MHHGWHVTCGATAAAAATAVTILGSRDTIRLELLVGEGKGNELSNFASKQAPTSERSRRRAGLCWRVLLSGGKGGGWARLGAEGRANWSGGDQTGRSVGQVIHDSWPTLLGQSAGQRAIIRLTLKRAARLSQRSASSLGWCGKVQTISLSLPSPAAASREQPPPPKSLRDQRAPRVGASSKRAAPAVSPPPH